MTRASNLATLIQPGSVIQMVTVTDSAMYSNSTTTFSDAGSITITPRFANSRIRIDFNCAMTINSGSNVGIKAQILRNGASFGAAWPYLLYDSGAGGQRIGMVPLVCYDAPGVITPVTYKIQIAVTNAGIPGYMNNYGFSNYTLTEIAQ